MPSPGCLRCGQTQCSCVLRYDPVTGFPSPGTLVPGNGSTTNPYLIRVPSCEDVQDCVGPMLGWMNGFVYNDAANRWEGTGTVGHVLTLQAGGNAVFAAAGGGGGPETPWTGTGGNGITVTAGGVNGHAPTISVNIGGLCNALDFVGGQLRMRDHRSFVSSIVSNAGAVGAQADGVDNNNLFPANLVVNNPSACRQLAVQMLEIHQYTPGANNPAGEGTTAYTATRSSGVGTIGSVYMISFYKNTGCSQRAAVFEGGTIPPSGSVTQNKGAGWGGASGVNTIGIAGLHVRTWVDCLGSTNV